ESAVLDGFERGGAVESVNRFDPGDREHGTDHLAIDGIVLDDENRKRSFRFRRGRFRIGARQWRRSLGWRMARNEGQLDAENGTTARLAFHGDRSAHRVDQPRDNGKAEARAVPPSDSGRASG